jgi:lysophospholipase L1-like esterase
MNKSIFAGLLILAVAGCWSTTIGTATSSVNPSASTADVTLATSYSVSFESDTGVTSTGSLTNISVNYGNDYVSGSIVNAPGYPGTNAVTGEFGGGSLTLSISLSDALYGTVNASNGQISGTYTGTGLGIGDWTATPLTTTNPKLILAALGDSYSAGNGTPQASGACDRSPQAWPELVPKEVSAEANSSSVDLLACSGAESTSSGSAGVEDLPAQITQLGETQPAPGIVTVTIGGDDGSPEHVGFRNVLVNCIQSSKDCAIYDTEESSWIAKDEPTLLLKDYNAIKAADPSAVVFAVGYPQILPDESCTGYNKQDAQILNKLGVALNAAIASAAAKVPGIEYVPASGAFSGHLLCSADPWIVPPLTVNAHTGIHDWMHPNVGGQEAIAKIVASYINDIL